MAPFAAVPLSFAPVPTALHLPASHCAIKPFQKVWEEHVFAVNFRTGRC